jgi:tetratricopeptide (TPR) repeat protein
MKNPRSSLALLAWTLGTTAFLAAPGFSLAATPCEPVVARMVSVQGNVEVRRAGQTQPQPARLNDNYCAGDRIQVGEKSRADLALVNQPLLRLDQKTIITLSETKADGASLIDLAQGALHFFSRLPRNLQINTAFVNAGIEGTEGVVEVEADRALVTIFEGKVLAANAAGNLPLTGGQSAVAEQGRAPVLRAIVHPRDAVQWALYYPPAAYFRPEDFQGAEPWQAMARKSYEAYGKADYQGAFDALKGVPDNLTDPRFFAYRASLLLAVGRVDEAGPDLDRALKLNPNYGDALALQSVIAVVQNNKEQALNVARKAVAVDPKSAAALTALSYAQQANFDLEGARSTLLRAVEVDPHNALAWARLAELHLSFADLDLALVAAQKAVSLNPNLSRTQMVLGFAHLTRVETSAAKNAFQKAIELDQADSLSRLGFGLAKIREGDLADGRREIEVAASLDPNNSIVRSYLGKAYYEEKRTDVAERDYAVARELDPKDPTPYFYDAIRKQTTNRPVEALQDMEKAIELNDNRAVYRSRLQLDSDLAARSASQARIYSDLGFQQLALVEGWKSVNTDPTNFSAHRFLADSYSILPRHEIARVSELLQSQLLQPLNMTPIQPRLAESNLFLISAGGPGGLSFNEFNPIFNRDGLTFQASVLGGENSTYSGEGVLAGIYKKMSFSLGGFHFQSDGFQRLHRTLDSSNTYQRDTIGDAFLQLELSPATSIQTEYRYRNRKNGDLDLRFFPADFRPIYDEKEERHSIRAGLRHAFSPSSILLGSFMYQHRDTSALDRPIGSFVTLIDEKFPDQKSISGEAQHLFRSQHVNLTSGIGYFDVNAKRKQALDFDPLFGIPPSLTITRENVEHANLYVYSYINLLKDVTFTLGASGDFFHTDSATTDSRNQFNPKIGVTWNPVPSTTLRAAAFRVLKRTLITDQTLEPTQVAGFNQFFDDINSTDSWHYGAAVDQKFSRTLFGGVEFSRRDLEVPFEFIDPITNISQVRRGDGREYLGRTYLFWTPHPWLGLSAEYQRERFKVDNDLLATADFKRLTTQRVPLGIKLFHPSGLSASLKPAYYHQDGDFIPRGLACCFSGRDSFWTVDAAVSYRLPKRYGFITIGAANLFDQKFKYFDTDRGAAHRNPRITPDRMIFGKITLALP